MGRFEGEAFDPEQWRSRVPTAAVLRARDDDSFWAALRVMAFSDEMIRAAVKTAEFSDPAAERLLGDVLIKRRNTIARVYLSKINPVVRPALDGEGTLTFANAAVDAGVAAAPAQYPGDVVLVRQRHRRDSVDRRDHVQRTVIDRACRPPRLTRHVRAGGHHGRRRPGRLAAPSARVVQACGRGLALGGADAEALRTTDSAARRSGASPSCSATSHSR